MAGPEVLRQLAEALMKLGEATKGPTPAAMVASKEAAAKRMAVSLADRAKEWSKKVMSKDKKIRQEAKQKEAEKKSPNKYNNDSAKLVNAQARLTNVQDGDPNNTPDGLEKTPFQINSTAIAEFTATLTQINKIPIEHRDPHVVYEEVGKLYRSIDWVNANPGQKAEARRAINAGLKFVKEITHTKGTAGSEFSQQILEDKSKVDYKLNLGISDEEHFDLYRSRQADLTADPMPSRAPRPGQTPRPSESGGKKLDRLLKGAQSAIDGTNTVKSEVDVLRKTYDQIFRDIKDGKYSETTAGEYRDLIQARMEDLQAMMDAERAPAGGGRGRGQAEIPGMASASAKLTPDQQRALLAGIPPEFRAAAKKILEFQDAENPTLKEIQEMNALYARTFHGIDGGTISDVRSKIDDFIKDQAGANASDAAQKAEKYKFENNRDLIHEIIMDQWRPLRDEAQYERAYFGLHPEHMSFLKGLDLSRRTSLETLTPNEKKTLFNIAQGIIDRAEDNPRAQFREGMDLYTSDNWKNFISILRDKATQANWRPADIEGLSNYFTGVREMRDLVHDLEFVSNFAGLEMLEKFTSNTLSADMDAWITYTPGMRYAMSVYHDNLGHIKAQHAGHLPPELVDVSMIKQTRIDALCRRQLEEALKSGQVAELKEMSDKYKLGMEMIRNGNNKGEDLVAEALREVDRSLKVAKAFSVLTLRTPAILAEAKMPYNFGSLPKNNMVQDMDWFRQGIVKYYIGKDARARFYVGLTHDIEGGNRLRTMSDHEVETFFFEMESHPKYGQAIAEFRNFTKVADRLGNGGSFWGQVLGMKDLPQEMRDLRGVGAKLYDAAVRAEREVRASYATEIDAKFGAGASGERRADVEEWWMNKIHEHHVEQQLETLYHHKIDTAFNELEYKLPGVVIDRASQDVGYERLNFDALEETLRNTDPDVLKQILKNPDGSDLVITKGGKPVVVRSLWDLYNVDTGNRPSDMDMGIPKIQKDDLNHRLDLMEAYAYQAKQDLSIIQQVATDKHWQYADGDTVNGVQFRESDMRPGMLNRHIASTFQSDGELFDRSGNSLGVISADKRRNLVRTYAAAIDHVISQPLKTIYHGEELIRPAYKDYLKERFEKGWEHNIITDTDIMINRFNIGGWGGSVLSRTIGDAKNNSTAQKGFWTMMEGLDGHPDWEKFAAEMKDKVGTPMAFADPVIAKNLEGFLWDTALYLYAGDPRMSNLGLAGHILTSEFVIETWEKLFGRKRVPDWMWGSYSKKNIDPGSEILFADDIWKLTHLAAEKGELPQEHHPLGWAASIYSPRKYTKEALRINYGGNPINILPQAFMTIAPIAIGLTLYQAFTEKDDEHH